MKLLYIAGPYRGENASEIRRNIENARAVAEELWAQGFAVICPHLNTAFMDGICPDENFLKGDLEILSRCDGIVMIQGWKGSKGALAEAKYAEAHNIPFYYKAGF